MFHFEQRIVLLKIETKIWRLKKEAHHESSKLLENTRVRRYAESTRILSVYYCSGKRWVSVYIYQFISLEKKIRFFQIFKVFALIHKLTFNWILFVINPAKKSSLVEYEGILIDIFEYGAIYIHENDFVYLFIRQSVSDSFWRCWTEKLIL